MEDDDQALEAALGALARAQDDEADARWADAADDDALRPIAGAELDGLLAAVLPTGAAEVKTIPEPLAFPEPLAPPAPVGFGVAWAGLAVAACLTLIALWPTPHLPTYSLTVAAGDQAFRGDALELGRFGVGSRLLLVARPAEDVTAISARVLRRDGAEWVPLAAPIEISETGSVRLDGVVGETLKLAPGPHELAVEVSAGAASQRLVFRVEIRPGPSSPP